MRSLWFLLCCAVASQQRQHWNVVVSPSDLSSVWIAMDCVRDCGPINRLFFATGVVGDYLLDEPFADFVSALSLNGGRVPWRREGLSFALNDTSAVITSIRFNLSFNNNGTIPFTCNDHATEAHVFISGYSFFVLMNASFDVSFVGWSNYSCFASSFEHSSALGLLDTPIMCGSTLQVFQINGMKLIVYDASKNYNLTHLKTAVLHASLALKDLKIENHFANYSILWEFLFGDPNQLGWALEHNAGFQCADSVFVKRTSLMWSFHVTHHVFHSFLLPRVAFTTELESNNQLEGTKSRFIWWAEGWAQYLALSKVAKWFDIQDAQLFFAHRFASSPAAVNSSLAVWSLEQYVNQTQWFPLFGAGAMLALKIDFEMRNTVGISLEEGLLRYRVLCLNGGAVSEEQFHTAWLDLTGFDVSPIFDKHVFGTTEINFEEALMLIGVKVNQDGSFTAGDPTRFALELFR